MKIQPSKWEKISGNETTNKGLISKIYKQFMQLNIKKKITKSLSGQKIEIDIFPEDIQMAKRHMKKILNDR